MDKFKVGDKVRFNRPHVYTTREGCINQGDVGVVVGVEMPWYLVNFPVSKKTHMSPDEIDLVTGSYLDSLAVEYRLLHIQLGQIQAREVALTKERQGVNDQIDKLGDKILEACRNVK